MVVDITNALGSFIWRSIIYSYMISIVIRAILFGEVWHEKYY